MNGNRAIEDRTTTAPWLQVPGLLLVVGMALYFLACFHFALRDEGSRWLAYGTWQMFTLTFRTATTVHAELEQDGKIAPLDLEALFPYRWETGPRYGKMAHEPERLKILARSACRRLRLAGGQAESVRLYGVRTTVNPYGEPRWVGRRIELLEHRCKPR